jgi:hypothetical protein
MVPQVAADRRPQRRSGRSGVRCLASCRLSRCRIEDQTCLVRMADVKGGGEAAGACVEGTSADALPATEAVFDEAED